MTTLADVEKPVLSGWCPPWRHATDHAECQRRLDAGELPRGCNCPDHTPMEETA